MCAVLPALILVACGTPEPHWAHDTLTLAPVGEGLSATQTWRLYGPRWDRALAERHRTCAMVFDLQPVGIEADCDACIAAWATDPTRTDGDCLPTSDPTFVALRRLGVASGAEGSTTWMDIGDGWEPHGGLDEEWGGEAVTIPADHAWELATTSSVSQLGRLEAGPRP